MALTELADNLGDLTTLRTHEIETAFQTHNLKTKVKAKIRRALKEVETVLGNNDQRLHKEPRQQ